MKNIAVIRLIASLNFPKMSEILKIGTLLTSLFFVSYSFGLSRDFLWSDDYSAYLNASNSAEHSLRDLRPIHALLTLVLFGSMEHSGQAALVRFLGLFLLIAFTLLAYILLRNFLYPAQALVAAFCIGHSPAIYSSLYWAMGVTSNLTSLIIGALGFLFWARGRWLLGLIFLVIAFSIYPLTALGGAALIFLIIVIGENTPKEFLFSIRSVLLAIIIGGIFSISLSLLTLKILDLKPNDRTDILSTWNRMENAFWFFTRILPQAFRPYLVSSPPLTTAVFQVCIFIIILLGLIRSWYPLQVVFNKLFQVLVLVVILLSPLPLSGHNQIEPRFFVGTSVFLLGYMFFLLISKVESLMSRNNKNWIRTITVTLICSLIISNYHFFNSKIRPIYSSTQTLLSKQLSVCSKNQLSNGILLMERRTAWPQRNLLGMYSQTTDLASGWVPRAAVVIYAFERTSIVPVIFDFNQENELDYKFCVVDLNRN